MYINEDNLEICFRFRLLEIVHIISVFPTLHRVAQTSFRVSNFGKNSPKVGNKNKPVQKKKYLFHGKKPFFVGLFFAALLCCSPD